MRILSLAVALFALAAILVGLHAPDVGLFLYAAAALLCAGATDRSAHISKFLRVFEIVFAVETIVFGAAYLIDALGLWPHAYADYALPSSLPLTVALFGSLVYAVSHIPVVRKMTDIADPYFSERAPTTARIWPGRPFTTAQNKLAIAALVFLIVINQFEVALLVRLNYFSRDFYNALQNKDEAAFWTQLLAIFLPFATIYIAALVVEYVVTSTFVYRWRRWLSAYYIGRWLGGGAHYPMALAGTPADNPDQRISEDIYGFIYGSGSGAGIFGYSITLLSTLTTLVSFAIVLWTLSAGFPLPGFNVIVPGLLFWIALIYAAIGTGLPIWIGRSLIGLYFRQQQYEANFRFGLARLREYSEQIALLRGEDGGDRRRDAPVRRRLRQLHEHRARAQTADRVHLRLRPDEPVLPVHRRRAALFSRQDPARRAGAGRARLRPGQLVAELLRLLLCRPRRLQGGARPTDLVRRRDRARPRGARPRQRRHTLRLAERRPRAQPPRPQPARRPPAGARRIRSPSPLTSRP